MLCRLLVTFSWTLLVHAIFESAGAVSIRNTQEWSEMTPDDETGIRVAQWNKEMNVNPEELGSYLEGDIIVIRRTKRSGMKEETYHWPNGVVPYKISGNFSRYL